MERAAQVHVEHRIEVFTRHFGKRGAPHVAGVVDQHVDPAERRFRGFDDRRAALGRGHRCRAGDGGTASSDDLVDDGGGGAGIGSGASRFAADVVDDDVRPARGQQQCVLAARPRPAPVMTATRPSTRSGSGKEQPVQIARGPPLLQQVVECVEAG